MLDCRSACVPFVQGPQFVAYCAPFLFPYHLLSDVKPPCALPRSICSTARNRVPATIACHGCDELGSSTRRLTISDLSDVDRGRPFVGIPRSVSEYFGVFSLLRVIRPELFSCTRLTLRLDADSLGNRQKFSPVPVLCLRDLTQLYLRHRFRCQRSDFLRIFLWATGPNLELGLQSFFGCVSLPLSSRCRVGSLWPLHAVFA